MATSFNLALTVLQVVAFLLGVITNGFMLGVNLSDWAHSKSLTVSDHFICAVGFSNLSLQIWSGIGLFCDLFWNSNLLCQFAYALKMISIHCSLLLSGQLCVFYCTRILTFNHNLFSRYRQMFLRSYRKFIMGAFIICIVVGGPLLWTGKNHPSVLNSSAVFHTATNEETYFEIYRTFVVTYGYIVPLMFTIGSTSLILISLIRHWNHMQEVLKTKQKAHLHAGFTVLSLLLVFVVYFITAIFNVFPIVSEGIQGFNFCHLILMLYAPAQSLVLIRGNSKLRNVAAKAQEWIAWVLKPKVLIKETSAVDGTQL